jgi:hypothetical protein
MSLDEMRKFLLNRSNKYLEISAETVLTGKVLTELLSEPG